MGRIEYKYLVPTPLLPQLRDYILSYVELDQYAAKREEKEYTVRSIYYDTQRYDFYHEKIEGLRKRKKLRIRAYNEYTNDSIAFLELKRKSDSIITKHRSMVCYQDLPALLKTGDISGYIKENNGKNESIENAKRFLFHVNNKGLLPVILICYEREAFYYKFNKNVRITFDKNLRSKIDGSIDGLFAGGKFIDELHNYFILEVKTGHNLPNWINYLISVFELRRQALSKYTICLDSHFNRGLQMKQRIPAQIGYHSSRINKIEETM